MLDPEAILKTITILRKRIEERFPERNLPKVCAELEDIASHAKLNVDDIDQPIWSLRLGIVALIVIALAALVVALSNKHISTYGVENTKDLIDVLGSGVNDLILISGGIYFLVSLEARIKRNKTHKIILELNSLVHVIDMYQLTKDPERLLKSWQFTQSSPKETMTAFELIRYLDYCTEMLAMVSKVASLHIQQGTDPSTVAMVNNMELLTAGLARKIWQKIVIVRSHYDFMDKAKSEGVSE